MTVYYGDNDYRDYLAHHGILGMKWGRQNGPPYPLGAGDHSASEKKAGWRRSLSSSNRGDLKRRKKPSDDEPKKSLRERINERAAERAEERAKAAEEKAVRDAEKLEAKKKAIADKAVEREDMRAFQKKSTAKLFTTDELLDIADRIDDERFRKDVIASRSETVRPTVLKKSGEFLNSIKKKKLVEEGDVNKILKNSNLFSTKELQEITDKFRAKQRLKEEKANATLYTVRNIVSQSAILAKNLSDIGISVVSVKKSVETLLGKTGGKKLDDIVASGDKNLISQVKDQLTGKQAGDAATNINNQERLARALNGEQPKQANEGQKQKQKQNQPQQQSNGDTQSQNNTSASESNGTDMDAFWRASAEKYDPNIAIRRKTDSTPMDVKSSRAMDQEISRYTSMTSDDDMRKVAEGVSRLQVMGTDWKKGGYSSAEEAATVRQQNRAVKESQQRIVSTQANQQERARVDEAIKAYRQKEANRKRTETRARNKAQKEAEEARNKAQKEADAARAAAQERRRLAEEEEKKRQEQVRRNYLGLG